MTNARLTRHGMPYLTVASYAQAPHRTFRNEIASLELPGVHLEMLRIARAGKNQLSGETNGIAGSHQAFSLKLPPLDRVENILVTEPQTGGPSINRSDRGKGRHDRSS